MDHESNGITFPFLVTFPVVLPVVPEAVYLTLPFLSPRVLIQDIFWGLDLSGEKASDYEIFKDVVKFSKVAERVPYEVDKLFWLIGSGNFYLNDIDDIATNKQFFMSSDTPCRSLLVYCKEKCERKDDGY